MQETEDTIGYKPVSKLAVLAAVAGLVSALALTTPLLWVLPLVGVALAVAGLADVARPGAEKVGRAAALLGLALSVGFGTQAVATKLAAGRLAAGRAVAVSGTLLDALRDGRLADVRKMFSQAMLPDSGMSAMRSSAAENEEKNLAAIAAMPAVVAIRGCGEGAKRDVQAFSIDDESGERWGARVTLSPCADGRPVEVRLEFDRGPAMEMKNTVERWTVSKIELGR